MPIIRRAKDCAEFERAAACVSKDSVFKLPQVTDGVAYYEASLDGLRDDSFLIDREGAVVVVRLCSQAGDILGHFGFPLEICVAAPHGLAGRRASLREALGEILRIARFRQAGTVEIRTSHDNDPEGLVASLMLGSGAVPALECRAEADLALSSDELAADMRKGHRQQTRWGLKNLKLVSIGQESVTRETTESLRMMHFEISGRITRPPESWAAAEALVAQGRGGYVLGYLDDDLLCGTIVMDGGDTAYYATGVYRREHFDKPLAHASIYQAMLDAKARGRRYFDLGVVRHAEGPPNDKEASIAYFKRGFSSRVTSSVIWRLDVTAAASRTD